MLSRQPAPRRETKATSLARLWIAALIASGLLSLPSPAPAANLTIGSFVQGSSWYVYAVNLGEMLREALPPGSNVDTPPIAGGLGNPSLVSAGKAQIAFGMAVVGSWAIEGKIGYKAPLKDLRALVGGWDDYYLVPMARGTGYSTDLGNFFKNVQPKARVTLLQRGGVGSFGGQQLLEIAGADEKTLASRGGSYEFGTFDMVKNRFAAGSGDIFVQVATIGHPSISEIAQSTPVTFLQPTRDELSIMTKRYGWESKALPKGSFKGQEHDVLLPSTTTTLFASTALADDLAYTIVKTICEKTDRLHKAHKALAKFDCAHGAWKMQVTGLPLHAGAERYYKERGWLQ